jgi:hypothetical protein
LDLGEKEMIAYVLMLPAMLYVAWMMLRIRKLQNRGKRSPFNEDILRTPGYSIRKAQVGNVTDFLMYTFGVIITPFFAFVIVPENVGVKLAVFGMALVFTAWCFYMSQKFFNTAIRLHQAVDAEMATGQELNLLMRDGAWVFHDIPYQYGNIDHVIVSSGGVFAIETKGYSKPTNNVNSPTENASITVDRGVLVLPQAKTRQPIEQAKTQAKWLHNEIERRFGLAVMVRPVVALPGWMIKGGFDGDCWVINPKRGNALRGAVSKPLISDSDVNLISSWIEDLARSVAPKSKELDAKPEIKH